MTAFTLRNPQPPRRDLTDPRSSGPPTPRRARPLLNDRRSTR
jgi:hypothetical protein